ncbi:reverse transcriptase domain-containing protein [Caballeronia arationis]|uniref:reverse transcriptase domain-containing protein n=1 Tax=Caballeronia arationis TaxID=1777142 RepID=UPI001ABE7C12|nr:reverse transcriptase domain-containing protein [Caballeronia arationis]
MRISASFYDTIEHDWLIRLIEHEWRTHGWCGSSRNGCIAGVLEDGRLTQSEIGTVQGGSISPLLSNIYLHYAFDLWVKQWRARHAEGDMIVVRYADDWVAGSSTCETQSASSVK